MSESRAGMGLKSVRMTASRLLEGLIMSSVTVVGARMLGDISWGPRESLRKL